MKSLPTSTLILSFVAAAVTTLAQPVMAEEGLTRAEVQAELARARAAGELRPWNDEVGFPRVADTPSAVTRAEVKAQLAAARNSGELLRIQRETYEPPVQAAQKTRAQVRAETAEARRLGLMRHNGNDGPVVTTVDQRRQIESAGLRARGESIASMN